MMIFSPDSLRAQVEAATGGHVTVLYDDRGYPSYMRVIPKFRYEDLGFEGNPFGTGVATAFLVNGHEKSEIFVGQYQAITRDGRALSLPGKEPRSGINLTQARSACAAKGPGWHLFTRHEWAAVALWCMANGFEPRGNTDYGRAHDAPHEIARRVDGMTPGHQEGGAAFTGSGPASWRHDGTIAGIADLVGNLNEWCDGVKLLDGRLYVTQDNHFELPDADWPGLDHYFSNESGKPTLTNGNANIVEQEMNASSLDNIAKAPGYTESQLLQRLLISPAGITPKGRFLMNNSGERFMICGGSWGSGTNSGLATASLTNGRSYSRSTAGFRVAFAL